MLKHEIVKMSVQEFNAFMEFDPGIATEKDVLRLVKMTRKTMNAYNRIPARGRVIIHDERIKGAGSYTLACIRLTRVPDARSGKNVLSFILSIRRDMLFLPPATLRKLLRHELLHVLTWNDEAAVWDSTARYRRHNNDFTNAARRNDASSNYGSGKHSVTHDEARAAEKAYQRWTRAMEGRTRKVRVGTLGTWLNNRSMIRRTTQIGFCEMGAQDYAMCELQARAPVDHEIVRVDSFVCCKVIR